MKRETVERFLEFLLIGVVLGTVEDLIAVKLATGATIDPRMILVIILVAIPFAAFSELIVDNDERKMMKGLSKKVHSTVENIRNNSK
jgi:hypothetical protein